jgi:VanZ family protein
MGVADMGLFTIAPRYAGPERRKAKPPVWVLVLAALAVAAIAYATLCPIGMRPHFASADLERFGAYFVLGLIICRAAPRRSLGVIAFVIALAFGLEAAQTFVPGRDGRFTDACVKATGGVVGAQLGLLQFAAQRNFPRAIAWLKARLTGPRLRRAV